MVMMHKTKKCLEETVENICVESARLNVTSKMSHKIKTETTVARRLSLEVIA